MKRIVLILLLLSAAVSAYAVGDQAYLGIFAETSVTKIAGMPAMPELPPGVDMSKLADMPGMAEMMGMGAPKRKLDVRLWSPGLAPANATAAIAPPKGLKQGDKLDLEIYRPKAESGTDVQSGNDAPTQSGSVDFTIKYYWGSSATVKPGQPKVIKMSSMTADQKRVMKESSQKVGASSYFYKPDWTTAYWPTKKQPGRIAKDAALPGAYTLTTSYTGNVTIDCPANVDFLGPIDMTAPSMEEKIDLEKPIKFEWKPIPNLLGSRASIFGMEGKSTLIMWSSSEVWQDESMSVDWDYLQMAQVRKFVADTVMMAGTRTDVTVPIGIFKDCSMANLTMVGYGPGVAMEKVQPIPRIQTKTTMMMMLGGKDMPAQEDTTDGSVPNENN